MINHRNSFSVKSTGFASKCQAVAFVRPIIDSENQVSFFGGKGPTPSRGLFISTAEELASAEEPPTAGAALVQTLPRLVAFFAERY